MRTALALMLLMACQYGPSVAQTAGTGQPATQPQQSEPADADQGFRESMDRMHREMMAAEPSGNAAVDFARMMIPHHQGAIDMARVVLAHTDDNKIREMAEDIIDDQKEEIEDLQKWLADQPGSSTTTGTTQ